MFLSDSFINVRERVINTVFGIDGIVLNSTPARSSDGPYVVAEMRRALNMMKAEAFDEKTHAVDYKRLRHSDVYHKYRAECAAQLTTLDLNILSTREEKIAFWINLYNALILDAVIAFNVKKSVTETRAGLVTFFRRAAYNIGGMRFAAEDIEHGILRGNRGNPFVPGPHFASKDARLAFALDEVDSRVHFALNCASRSCPTISVYDSRQLHQQLDAAAITFVNGGGVSVDPKTGSLQLSRIFQWYANDFGGKRGVLDTVTRFLEEGDAKDRLLANEGGSEIRYQKYDWGLNH